MAEKARTPAMMNLALIMAGGAIGSALRYLMSGFVHKFVDPTFPYGTLAVNLVGSAIIGFLWGLSEGGHLPSGARSFLFIGLLGGFTTFSTFALESMHLVRDGEIRLALVNIGLHNLGSLALVFLAFYCVRLFMQAR